MSHVLYYLVSAATPGPSPSGTPSPTPSSTAVPIDPNKVQAGAIGLMFFVLMAAAVALLVMSMRRHLGRVDVTRHEREKNAGGGASPDGEVRPKP
jgi:hypothetical protein